MQNLNKPLEEGYSFNFSDYYKGGWDIMKSQLGTYIGITVLFLIIQFVISSIPYVSILSNLVSPILYAGYFIYARRILQNKQEASDLFKGFNHAPNIILQSLIVGLMLVPLFIILFSLVFPIGPFIDYVVGSIGPQEFGELMGETFPSIGGMMFIAFFLVMIIAIYISISYIFAIPLIVDANLGAWQAMELSRKVVGKHFFSFLVYLILTGILMMIGIMITCGLGMLFVIPLIYCVIFSAYDQIFQPYVSELKSDIDSFGEITSDINTESQEDNH